MSTDRLSSRHRCTVALVTIAFVCCGLTWILALAPFTGIDEFDHAFRADSVAQGYWQPGTDTLPRRLARGDLIPVHADLATRASAACLDRHYTRTYNCLPYAVLPGGDVLIASAAARYNPVYYAIAGTLAKPFHGDAELYALRLAGLLMSAGLLATALRALLLTCRTRWPVIALLAGVLPTTVYSAAVAAPNGTQMMAGLAVWATGLALVRRDDRPRWLYPAMAVAVSLLATTHTLGCLWLGLIGAGLALYAGLRRALRSLRPRTPGEGIGLAVMLASIVFEVVWVVLARTNSPTGDGPPGDVHLWPGLANGLILWPLQAVAAYPMRDNAASPVVYAVSLTFIALVATVAFRRVTHWPSARRIVLFAAAATVAVPMVATIAAYAAVGFAWQGRYGMPFSVGLFVLAGLALDRRPELRRRHVVVLAAVPPLWALAQALGAYRIGAAQRDHGHFSVPISWQPPSMGLVWLFAIAGLAGASWLAWALVRDDGAPTTARP